LLYTNTEIDLLRLCGWCKDLPVNSKNINREDLSYLLLTGQLRASRNGISIRVTEKGKATLDNLGYSYEYDRKSRGVGTFLTRRLQTAELMLFLFQGKTDVFCSSVPDRNSALSFLPAFALRREKNKNPLGTARFNGMLYTKNTATALYYISDRNDGLYPETERNTFSMNILTGGRKSAAAFTGAGELGELLSFAQRKTTNSKALPYFDAVRRLDCPVSFFPLSENGARQIRIMSVKEHRRIIAQNILKKKYTPPEHRWYDAGGKILVGIDLDFPRMETAAEYGVHIFLLDWQVDAAKEILRGKKAVLHPIKTGEAEELLGLSPELHTKETKPYVTKEGELLSAPIKMDSKA